MHRSIRSALASLALALAALGSPNVAHASQAFPEYLAGKLQMPCAPGCQLCHNDASGGPQKINKKFGVAVRAAGATAILATNLDTALTKMQMAGTDTDVDGIGDVAELQAGTDPNEKDAELCGGLKYGCGASTLARRPAEKSLDPAATGASALTVLVGLLLLRRRRR